MSSLRQFDTSSEELFAAYLDLHEIPWTPKPQVGQHRPDFLVNTGTGDVACEVKEWTKSPLPGHGVHSLGPEQVYGPIHAKMRDSYAQAGSCHDAGFPFVLVLDATTGTVCCEAIDVFGAMMGEPVVLIPVGPDAPDPPTSARTILDSESRQGKKPGPTNERYSALAVLSKRNPTAAALDAFLDTTQPERAGLPTDEAGIEVLRAIERAKDAGVYYPDLAAEPGLDVYHNPYAAFPLDKSVFDNPTTRQWRMSPEMKLFSIGERRTPD